jgi:hypothetical protein
MAHQFERLQNGCGRLKADHRIEVRNAGLFGNRRDEFILSPLFARGALADKAGIDDDRLFVMMQDRDGSFIARNSEDFF